MQGQTDTRQFWNQWNATYRGGFGDAWNPDEATARRHDTIVAWAAELGLRDAAILEVSCGAGWLSEQLRAFGSVTGVDIADEIVAKARLRFPRVTFVAGDFYTMELPEHHYDLVVCVDGLSCVPDQPAFVRRLAERLKPAGRLILATPNRFVWERTARDERSAAPIRHWHSRRELRETLAPWFEVERLATVAPGGNRGLLRLVNSGRLERLVAPVVPPARLNALRERLGVGRSLVVQARPRPDAPPATRPRAIGYLYPSGWGNLGDEAIQQSAIASFRACWPGVRIRAFTLNPAAARSRHGIEAEPVTGVSRGLYSIAFDDVPLGLHALRRSLERAPLPALARRILLGLESRFRTLLLEARSLSRAWRWARGADLLVAAGGGQLDDVWGGPWGHPYALARWAWLARRAGVPFVLLSQGFGELRTARGRGFVRYAVRRASYCSCRDAGSRDLVAALGVGRELPVVPDLAFGLAKAPGEPPGGPSLALGLSPISFRLEHTWPEADRSRYEGYVRLWADVVTARAARGDVVHLYTTNPADEATVDAVLARLDPGARAACVRERVTTVDELLALCARLDLTVASRLHGVVLALVAERPVLALSYERKVRTVMADAGLERHCLDLDAVAADGVCAAIDQLAARRRETRAAIAAKAAEWRAAVQAQAGMLAAFARRRA